MFLPFLHLYFISSLVHFGLMTYRQEYLIALANYNNYRSLYNNLKDGGNTQAAIEEVESAWPSEMWELRADLLDKSPHLSMDLLKAAADKTDVFPESVIFEIMAANPDELKKEELIRYLEEKENPLPQYMIDILKQVANGTTFKTVLEQQMAHFNQNKTRIAYDIVRSNLNDSVANVAELREWLNNIGGVRADEQIIVTYMIENNYSAAIAHASLLPDFYNYSVEEIAENDYYLEIINLYKNLYQHSRTIYELDSTEVSNLNLIAANSNGTAGIEAKGILEMAFNQHFCNCIYGTDSTGYKSIGLLNPESLSQVYGFEVRVEPNPAKEWTAFNYALPNDKMEGVIKICDVAGNMVTTFPISGKQGQKIWATQNIEPGVYFYTLYVSEFSNTGKIVIIK